jgi:hypothetical protein
MSDLDSPATVNQPAVDPVDPLARRVFFAVVAVAVLALVVVLVLHNRTGSTGETVGGSSTAHEIEQLYRHTLSNAGLDGSAISVECPGGQPLKAGFIFSCQMSGYPGGAFNAVRVTEDDAKGNVEFNAYFQ